MLYILRGPYYNSCLMSIFDISTLLPCLHLDVKFDAVSGDYYPIVYFNDYWNLQKDYYPINETLTTLPLRLSYCPLSLWRWQLYAAQNARSPWNFLPEDTYEQSDEDQDSVKVRNQESQRQNNHTGLILGSFKLSYSNNGSFCIFTSWYIVEITENLIK